ncbi:MlaD family protein [Nocardioides sp. Root79]|uniref:MlaD family protein n=1 Tax=Nocardioides sp. Root79 TaxID=1736600 RepID=UPI001CED4149|nr:MlaD family protein [Nocardioides sp. Root79]
MTSIAGLRAMNDDERPDVFAVFASASPLIEGNDVKVAGVTVGKVESIEVRDGKALVGMSLDEDALPLHDDAKATIRPLSLLGERFVEIDRGTADAGTLASGDTIPVDRTSSAVDIDQVLNALDEPTGQALAALLTSVGNGMADRGEKVDGAIKALQPALEDTDKLVKVLDDQSAVLARMVTELQPVATSLASDNGKKLDGLLDAADELLRSTAAKQSELDATLTALPGTLASGRRTLRALRGAADATTPTLANLRPTTAVLSELTQELSGFAQAGAPAMKDLQPVLQRAQTLLKAAGPVAASMRRSSPNVLRAARGLQPIGTELISNLRHVLDFAKFWALTTNNSDGLSNYFRSLEIVNTEAVTGLLPPPKAPKNKPAANGPRMNGLLDGLLGDGGVLGSASGLGDLTDGLLTSLGGLLTGAKAGRSAGAAIDPVNVTGLTARQEQDMVTYLVGGAR